MRKPNLDRRARKSLLAWFAKSARDLPWRRTRDPWAIWVSETMLQQTRVETVLPYFRRFLRRFPTVRALARADLDDVLSLWQGLGYYARARNFHAAARRVVERHGGEVPRDREARLALPGVGRYTAGALGSIAFGLEEPVLDGNVERVLCRLHGIASDPRETRMRERLWSIAGEIVRGERPGDLNQALMELGATVCTPREPVCEACPVRGDCCARKAGTADEIPSRRRHRQPLVLGVACRIVRGGRWLVVRREHGGLLGGLWELPGASGRGPDALAKAMKRALGVEVEVGEKLGTVRHVFTHRRLRLDVYEGRIVGGRMNGAGFAERRWARRAELGRLPMSTLQRRVVDAVG